LVLVEKLLQLLAACGCWQPPALLLQCCMGSVTRQCIPAVLEVLLQLPPCCWTHAYRDNKSATRTAQAAAAKAAAAGIASDADPGNNAHSSHWRIRQQPGVAVDRWDQWQQSLQHALPQFEFLFPKLCCPS
jgi:hypothetical protein